MKSELIVEFFWKLAFTLDPKHSFLHSLRSLVIEQILVSSLTTSISFALYSLAVFLLFPKRSIVCFQKKARPKNNYISKFVFAPVLFDYVSDTNSNGTYIF